MYQKELIQQDLTIKQRLEVELEYLIGKSRNTNKLFLSIIVSWFVTTEALLIFDVRNVHMSFLVILGVWSISTAFHYPKVATVLTLAGVALIGTNSHFVNLHWPLMVQLDGLGYVACLSCLLGKRFRTANFLWLLANGWFLYRGSDWILFGFYGFIVVSLYIRMWIGKRKWIQLIDSINEQEVIMSIHNFLMSKDKYDKDHNRIQVIIDKLKSEVKDSSLTHTLSLHMEVYEKRFEQTSKDFEQEKEILLDKMKTLLNKDLIVVDRSKSIT